MAAPKNKAKRWTLRLLAVVLGCMPLLLCEMGLRIMGWPSVAPPPDPLVDLHHLQPLFTLSPDKQTYFIGPERLNLFREATFAATKPAAKFRIFALGESTTQGEPYSTATAYPAWLDLELKAATGRDVEVINCGGLSYASYRIRAILHEVLENYSPDLIILYCGQNEFLEERTYEGWREVPLPIARASGWLSSLKLAELTRWLVQGSAQRDAKATGATVLKQEVDALLDYNGGLDAYHRDDAWREPVVEHYRWNMTQMVSECRAAQVPIILCNPVVNLLDCPPIKFERSSRLTPPQAAAFDEAWNAAQANAQQPDIAKQFLATALTLDPDHAGANFFMGRLEWEAGHLEQARDLLVRAKDNDVCPLRALSAMQAAIHDIALHSSVPLLNADQLFGDRSQGGLVGNKWLVDHVHPNIEGHQLLGESLCDLILADGLLTEVKSDWRSGRTERWRAHLSTLHDDYFQRGKQRLEGLMLWTQGRAKKIRLGTQ